MRTTRKRWAVWAMAAVCAYAGVSFIAYGLAHPELTEAQRLLRLWQALTWSWE